MKVNIDMENLTEIVEGSLKASINEVIHNTISEIVANSIKKQFAEKIEDVVGQRLTEYINEYLDTSKITVGGGWGEETKEYTASEYIKQHIGEMMRQNQFTVTETSGYNSGRKVQTTFEDYVKRNLDIDTTIKKSLDEFCSSTKQRITRELKNSFDESMKSMLSSTVLDMLMKTDTYQKINTSLTLLGGSNG